VNTGARDGVILVAVLWTVALLALLAIAASVTFRGFTAIIGVEREQLKAEGLLTAGLEVAGGLLSSAGDTPVTDIESNVVLASGAVRLRLDDEGGRIDIGRAPVELLAALLHAANAANPDALAKEVVDWRREGALTAKKAGNNADTGAGGAFSDVYQLAQVPGMRPDWVAAIAPLATVFGNRKVNPLTAPPQVIAILPGAIADRVAAFLDARRASPADATRSTGLLGNAQQFLEVKPVQAASVALTATLADGYGAGATAVIACPKGDPQPYRVLSWKPSTP
jgi:general secretion pathway protein K